MEDENARLKKIVADLTLDREMLQYVSAIANDYQRMCLGEFHNVHVTFPRTSRERISADALPLTAP